MVKSVGQKAAHVTSDVVERGVKIGAATSGMNLLETALAKTITMAPKASSWGSTTAVTLTEAIGQAVISPLTAAMVVTTVVDTIFEKRNVSWRSSCIRRVPGFLLGLGTGLAYGATAPVILKYYLLCRGATKATELFANYGKNPFIFQCFKEDMQEFVSDLRQRCYSLYERCCKKEEETDEFLLELDAHMERNRAKIERAIEKDIDEEEKQRVKLEVKAEKKKRQEDEAKVAADKKAEKERVKKENAEAKKKQREETARKEAEQRATKKAEEDRVKREKAEKLAKIKAEKTQATKDNSEKAQGLFGSLFSSKPAEKGGTPAKKPASSSFFSFGGATKKADATGDGDKKE